MIMRCPGGHSNGYSYDTLRHTTATTLQMTTASFNCMYAEITAQVGCAAHWQLSAEPLIFHAADNNIIPHGAQSHTPQVGTKCFCCHSR